MWEKDLDEEDLKINSLFRYTACLHYTSWYTVTLSTFNSCIKKFAMNDVLMNDKWNGVWLWLTQGRVHGGQGSNAPSDKSFYT